MRTTINARNSKRIPNFVHRTCFCWTVLIESAWLAYPDKTRFARRRRIRFLMRAALSLKTTVLWLDACSASRYPGLAAQGAWCLERIHRPFLHKALFPREILRVSLEHQQYVYGLLPSIATQIADVKRAVIATFSVGTERWQVALEILDQLRKEGDWTLCIRDEQGIRVASCSFSIATLKGKIPRPRILIGCVQGPDKSTKGRDLFRSLTRKWHGLRPKHLVIYLLQIIAREIDAHNVLMVSNSAHIYSSWRYPTLRSRVASDYGTLAAECGATRHWRGWLLLRKARQVSSSPCAHEPKTRRHRRGLLVAQLDMQVRCAVHSKHADFDSRRVCVSPTA
ncbi:DUF535 family protein [Caballeronia cordobensis]|uniref:DUF535 family protein n=1 Tax=Caballeronia cordobensis TaxID=1353886 RepID=UPI00045EF956|nr:putative membrane protein [Burkholderia sp. RPE67]